MIKPYVGITGFTQRSEVERLLAQLDDIGFPDSHLLMVGVLVSAKTIRGEPLRPEWAARYPDPAQAGGIFVDSDRCLNLVHYNSKGEDLADELCNLAELIPEADGVQLNIAWPDPLHLALYPRISWDAEGELRTDDTLDLTKCRDYLQASVRLISAYDMYANTDD